MIEFLNFDFFESDGKKKKKLTKKKIRDLR